MRREIATSKETIGAYNYLFEHGTALFRMARTDASGILPADIRIVMLGCGPRNREMLKALSWACQIDGYRLDVEVYGERSDYEKFAADCPELTIPNPLCRICHKPQIDAAALGTGKKLPTMVFVDDKELIGQIPSGFSSTRLYSYDLQGGAVEEDMLDLTLEGFALRRHLQWGKEEDFYNNSYNYQSSVASALQLSIWTRKDLGLEPVKILSDPNSCPEKVEAALDSMGRMEHRRWCAFLYSQGWKWSGSLDKASRDNSRKLHHNLVPYDDLSIADKMKDWPDREFIAKLHQQDGRFEGCK